MGKKEKQFSLTSKKNCCIYLMRIISSCELGMDKLKDYNKQLKKQVESYRGAKLVPWKLYGEMTDKSYNVIGYLVNLLGDSQASSISYFKYRSYIKKQVDRGNNDIPLYIASEKMEELLKEFNKKRNWLNHVPESLLVAEMSEVDSGNMEFSMDPVEIVHYNYVTFEKFEHLYLSNVEFYEDARSLIQVAKREYSMLMGKTVKYPRTYTNKPDGMERTRAVIKSAKIQGIKSSDGK